MEDNYKELKLSSLTSPVLFQIQTEVPSKGSPKISVLFSAKAKSNFSKDNPQTMVCLEP